MNIDDILFHLGESTPFGGTSASPPIYQTSNFIFSTLDQMKTALQHEDHIPFYTRGANPTVQVLQEKIAALEETEHSLIFASGSAAITAAIISQVKAGDHIVCVSNPYSWTKKLIEGILAKFSVASDFVEASDTEAILAHVRENTRLIYLESPNSWTYEMQDIEVITTFAKQQGIRTILDNSCASPLYQKPARYGVDIIVHSSTKYLSGHADVVSGVLCTSSDIYLSIFKNEYMTFGAIISPLEAWLMIRSLRSLELRMEKVSKNALEVARFLEKHPKIAQLFYTHSESFAQPELVEKYLTGNGGLMTIDLKTNNAHQVEQFCNTLKRFKLGCSWGGFESLAFPAITTMSSLNYNKPDTAINRIRLYVGLEDSGLLIDDLTNALEIID